MTTIAADDDQTPRTSRLVVMVAASMPPVQGQALVAHRVGELLTTEGHETRFVSRNPSRLHRGAKYYAAVLIRLCRAVATSVRLRWRTPKSVYVTSSGGLGVAAEGLCVALLLRRRDRLVVHHHSFAYLTKRSSVFRITCRTAYRHAHHVVLCQHMAELLIGTGVAPERVSVVSNAGFIDAPTIGTTVSLGSDVQLRLGHLSNLSIEKGLDLVVGILGDTPDNVSLTLFGTPVDSESATTLRLALSRFPRRLRHVQPTDRTAVWEFFNSIDLFVFPSRYRNEAAPLVVLEALAAGVPVIASDRGCIPSQLSPELVDFAVSIEAFPSSAAALARSMLSDNRERLDARQRALRQWSHLKSISALDVSELLLLILPKDDS